MCVTLKCWSIRAVQNNLLKIENYKTFAGDYNWKTITLCKNCYKLTDGIYELQNEYKNIYLKKLNS